MKVIRSRGKPRNLRTSRCCGLQAPINEPEEMHTLRSLRHDHVVEFLDCATLHGRYCLLTRFAEHGTLEQLLVTAPGRLLPETVARRYGQHVASALDYLHGRTIAHRNINASNVLLDRHDSALLSGFGMAVHHSITCPPITSSFPPSTPYQPPEVLQHCAYEPRKLDVWALGVLLYRLTTGSFIFGENVRKIAAKSTVSFSK